MHNDVSIKNKDVKTNNFGEYSTKDSISVLSVVCLSNNLVFGQDVGFPLYTFFYNKL